MTIHLGRLISGNALWIIPMTTVALGVLFKLLECSDDIDFYSIIDFGMDLITSAIILLVTNYQSEVTAWLLLASLMICMAVLVFRRHIKRRRYRNRISVFGIIVTIAVGLLLIGIAMAHIDKWFNIVISDIVGSIDGSIL